MDRERFFDGETTSPGWPAVAGHDSEEVARLKPQIARDVGAAGGEFAVEVGDGDRRGFLEQARNEGVDQARDAGSKHTSADREGPQHVAKIGVADRARMRQEPAVEKAKRVLVHGRGRP